MTVAQALGAAARAIETSGHAASPRREAEEILGAILGRDRSWLFAHGDEPLGSDARAALHDGAARRATGEPVAYVTGSATFCDRPFAVSRATLIPRPETEDIVARARALRPRRILDVGTGTGCLAVTLAIEHPGSRVTGTDVSIDALAVARSNAKRHGARVTLARADGLDALRDRAFDLVVANPPYVDATDRASLPAEVRDFEPAVALYSPRGLAHLERWIPAAARCLAPGGSLLVEIGFGQAGPARAIVGATPLRLVAIHPDFAGIPRILEAAR
ncbi:MAG: peptide chain release factor N(5)-glutamine methyltransferase [Acidobacteriota bacterium]